MEPDGTDGAYYTSFLQEYIGSWKKGVGIGDMQSYATLETNGCC
jgi:hypothetical protein